MIKTTSTYSSTNSIQEESSLIELDEKIKRIAFSSVSKTKALKIINVDTLPHKSKH